MGYMYDVITAFFSSIGNAYKLLLVIDLCLFSHFNKKPPAELSRGQQLLIVNRCSNLQHWASEFLNNCFL